MKINMENGGKRMFVDYDYRDVEPCCYEEDHVEKVIDSIRPKFEEYFERFIETEAGNGITADEFEKLRKKFGGDGKKTMSSSDRAAKLRRILIESIDEFQKDREAYKAIFDLELLEEYRDDDDADTFKSKTLRNECPIIRKTLANKRAKELGKYRAAFSHIDPYELLDVVINLCEFSEEYIESYDQDEYETYKSYEDLELSLLDTDEYTAYGVIGGGIKTMMLHKIYPAVFPSRSRSALWAMWYLTDKKSFGCETDSEFLMIDTYKNIVQQNYFYPYELFAFYAYAVYKMIQEKAAELDVHINKDYKYVIVDSFFDYVAMEHDSEISFLKTQIRNDGGMGYV